MKTAATLSMSWSTPEFQALLGPSPGRFRMGWEPGEQDTSIIWGSKPMDFRDDSPVHLKPIPMRNGKVPKNRCSPWKMTDCLPDDFTI